MKNLDKSQMELYYIGKMSESSFFKFNLDGNGSDEELDNLLNALDEDYDSSIEKQLNLNKLHDLLF